MVKTGLAISLAGWPQACGWIPRLGLIMFVAIGAMTATDLQNGDVGIHKSVNSFGPPASGARLGVLVQAALQLCG